MSVLIRGMKMPKDCLKCPFCLFADGYWKCLVDGSHADFGGTCRPSLCPLVSVPPHGDLIDRDALSESLKRLCDRVCQYSKAQRKVMCGACPLGDAFAVVEDDAPTIIEADKEGKG